MIEAVLNLSSTLNAIEGADARVSMVLEFNAPPCFQLSPSIMEQLSRDFGEVDHQVGEPVAYLDRGLHTTADGRQIRRLGASEYYKHTITLRFRS